jgi:hypothetical protein
MNEQSELPTYKPSVFYFRKKLHEAKSRDRAITVALIVSAELEQLKLWSATQGIGLCDGVTASAECMREALRTSGSRSQVILLGLFLCHELDIQPERLAGQTTNQPAADARAGKGVAAKGTKKKTGTDVIDKVFAGALSNFSQPFLGVFTFLIDIFCRVEV